MPDTNHEGPTLASLLSKEILRRAFFIALVLGSVLMLANQSNALFGNDDVHIPRLILVYLTPFVVVTISQILGVRRAMRDVRSGHRPARHGNTFVTTALSHGIPLRSLLVGSIAGFANTSIVALAALVSTGTISDLPIAVIMQAFSLPMMFGLISQTISYRRELMAIVP